MSKCIYTLKDFDDASGEHILQNFLGARWTSEQISCNEIQDSFGSTIDTALENGLKQFRVILGHRGGRGGAGPTLKNVSTTTGEKVHISPGGRPNLAEPTVSVKPNTDGTYCVSAILGIEKHLGWALNKLRQDYPHLNLKIDEDELKKGFKHKQDFSDGRMHLSMKMGGMDFFRGALKSCFNFVGAVDHQIAVSNEFDSLRDFVLNSSGEIDDFARWMSHSDRLDLPSLGQFDHFIGLAGYGGIVSGVIQFYGEIAFPVRLTTTYSGKDFQCSYLVDPFREHQPAEIRNARFRFDAIPVFTEQPKKPEQIVWDGYAGRFKRILERWYTRTDEINVREIVESILLPKDGEILDETTLRALSQKLNEYLSARIAG